MRLFTASLAVAAALALLASPVIAEFVPVKPDLRILSIGASPWGAKYARIVVANSGFAPSAGCALRVQAAVPLPQVKYLSVPPLAGVTGIASTTKALDVYIGASPFAKGQLIHAFVDCFGQVAETNEGNNAASIATIY